MVQVSGPLYEAMDLKQPPVSESQEVRTLKAF